MRIVPLLLKIKSGGFVKSDKGDEIKSTDQFGCSIILFKKQNVLSKTSQSTCPHSVDVQVKMAKISAKF